MSFEEIASEQHDKIIFKRKYPKLHDFEKKVIDTYVN
jgi:hypothetical protein